MWEDTQLPYFMDYLAAANALAQFIKCEGVDAFELLFGLEESVKSISPEPERNEWNLFDFTAVHGMPQHLNMLIIELPSQFPEGAADLIGRVKQAQETRDYRQQHMWEQCVAIL